VLKDGATRTTASQSRVLQLVVVAEFALSLVLLVAAMLLARSYLAVADTPLGFHADHVLTLRTSLPDARYDDRQRAALVERIVAACRVLPGVTDAAAVSTLPLTGESEGWGLLAEGNPNTASFVMTRARAVTPGYFRTMGIQLLAGRDFDATDRGRIVGAVNATAARRLWPGVANPVGRRLRGKTPMTIVAVVADTRASGLDNEVRPYLYVPFWVFAPPSFALTIHTDRSLSTLVPAIKSIVWQVDKDQPITHVEAMNDVVFASIGSRRFPFILITTFGVFALVLAAIGMYAVLSYAVTQRTREIGIRLALGASRATVVATILRDGAVLAAVGAVVGVGVARLLVPALRALLYGVTAVDPPVFAGAVVVLLAIAFLASVVPAFRAARLDPAISLRV
jgi:putative ABC transport system permease protein